jgi:predicted kinase
MHPVKHVYILIGPKGSGKTYMGSLLESRAGIPFLRVEDVALRVRKDRHYADGSYVQEVFAAIEQEVRSRLETAEELIFESTGLTDAFDLMLRNLQADFSVMLIRIVTDPEKCAWRVQHRDQSLHVNVSDDHVRAINVQVVGKAFAFAGEIHNDEATPDQIVDAFTAIKKKTASGFA